MKYAKELYVDSGIHDDCEDIENHEEKIVKCRKPHICSECQEEILIGEYAVVERGFMDGEPVSCYTCMQCIENWLEESGQILE